MLAKIVFNQADLWTQNYKLFLWKQYVHSDLKAFHHL